jgi:O-methyltransferase involved in polyketide biosynthesis
MDVSGTAYLAAACRAASPRIRDPYARLFTRDDPALDRLLAAGGDEVVVRTGLLDEVFVAAVADRDRPVVLNLGAGFCTRPYRLDLSGCSLVVEVDAAPILAEKERILAPYPPTCPVSRVPGDVRDRASLLSCLNEVDVAARPFVVVTEGLLPYLSAVEIGALAGSLREALGDAVWLTDLVSVASARGMARLAGQSTADLTLYGLATLEPFEDNGWSCVDYRILPFARAATTGASSRQVVDGVVVLRHIGTGMAPG